MKKRGFAALLAVMMLAAMIPAAFAASDIDTHWAKSYIEYLDSEGVINPSATTGKYSPDREMTRAEFMRYINRAFHFTDKTTISYSDVPTNAWYYETVQIAARYGYINGTGNNKMNPEGKVTREQAAVLIGRLFKEDPGETAPSSLSFTDKHKVSSWAAGYIQKAADNGIITGYSDGSFKPSKIVTRAEVAKILYYYIGTSLSTAGKAYTGADLKNDTLNATISENCTLSDAAIKGDLYLTEGLGSDAVTLTNVTIDGSLIISGGTVTLVNTTCDQVIVSSPMGRLLQVTATGATSLAETEVRTAATLYDKGLTDGYDGFSNVTVNGENRVSLTLDADVSGLVLESEATVSTTAGTEIYQLTANDSASVTGYGEVYQAEINSSGVSFASSVAVSGYTLKSGVSATISGQTVSESSAAGASPSSISVDLNNLTALGTGTALTLPANAEVSSVTCDGILLAANTDYQKTGEGIRLTASWLGKLSRGKHTLAISLADGGRASVSITVTDSSAASAELTDVSFDRYYKSSGFRDVSITLGGTAAGTSVSNVVLGLSKLDYTYDSASGVLTLRRGILAQLRQGIYTIAVDLADGTEQSVDLTVSDSAPSGVKTCVAEYNTFSPTAPSFILPLSTKAVSSVTAIRNSVVQTLVAGTDYVISGNTLTLPKTTMETYRLSSGYVEFTVTLSDNTIYTLVIDYIS